MEYNIKNLHHSVPNNLIKALEECQKLKDKVKDNSKDNNLKGIITLWEPGLSLRGDNHSVYYIASYLIGNTSITQRGVRSGSKSP